MTTATAAAPPTKPVMFRSREITPTLILRSGRRVQFNNYHLAVTDPSLIEDVRHFISKSGSAVRELSDNPVERVKERVESEEALAAENVALRAKLESLAAAKEVEPKKRGPGRPRKVESDG